MAGVDLRLLDHALLDRFADALRRCAPPVAASMGPGLSEDEVRTVCAQASLEPSSDALAWFTYWDALEQPLTRYVEVLPAFQASSLTTCIRSSIGLRRGLEQMLAGTELVISELWPSPWLLLFTDGGGGHTILDCSAPQQPSLLRDCWREDFAQPSWGEPIASLAPWIANGTEWMAGGTCRFDSAREQWRPPQAANAYRPHFDISRPPNPPIPGLPD